MANKDMVEVRCYCTGTKWEVRELPLHACGGCGDFFEVRAVLDALGDDPDQVLPCCREYWQAGILVDGFCPECGRDVERR